jgi:hypothetical protein
MIIKAKALEIGKFHLKMHLTLKIMNSEKCVFNKSYSFLCYLNHGCIIYK